jgi:Alginate lyase
MLKPAFTFLLLLSLFSGHAVAADDLPRVFLLNAKVLAEQKASIANNKNSVLATKAKNNADSAMKEGPFSVMQKDRTPPSGNKHDYMSQAPYFWADPKSPTGLPYIQRDGERNPEIEKISDHNNIGKMAKTARTLALAYYLTGNQVYADRAALILRTWFLDPETYMRPNLEFGQAIPGVNTGRSIGIIETPSLTSVVDAVGLLAGSKSWGIDDQKKMTAWFADYLKWLQGSEHGRKESKAANNHGTYYDMQVADFAFFVGDRELAKQILLQAETKLIASQVEPDGRQPLEMARTRSLSYSVMNLRGLINLAYLGDQVGLDLWHFETKDGRSIRKALDYLVPYAQGEKKWERQQITDFKLPELVPEFLRAAAAYKNPTYAEIATKIEGDDTNIDTLLLRAALNTSRSK